MEYKQLTKKVKIPVLGLGTWSVGGRYEPDNSKDREEIEAMRKAIKLGVTHIDTAEKYAKGHAEEIVGKVIKPLDRENVFITTKVSGDHLRYDDVIEACEKSLKRLETNYIDLYLVHWPDAKTPLKETMEAMEKLVNNNSIRFIGVSNFSVKNIIEAQKHLKKHKIVNNQVHYNLLEREAEKEVLPYCQKNNIIVTAYSPVAKGALAKPGFVLLDAMVKKYNKTQAQVALNWLISKKNVIAIPKMTNLDHIKENLGSLGWKMDKKDVEILNKE